MTPKDYEMIQNIDPQVDAVILGHHLTKQTDRTLLYGYTCERETHHVYIKSGIIYSVRYFKENDLRLIDILTNHDYVPDKRLYPARCDFEFCYRLRRLAVTLSFTTYEARELTRPLIAGCYFGEILNHTNHR